MVQTVLDLWPLSSGLAPVLQPGEPVHPRKLAARLGEARVDGEEEVAKVVGGGPALVLQLGWRTSSVLKKQSGGTEEGRGRSADRAERVGGEVDGMAFDAVRDDGFAGEIGELKVGSKYGIPW